MLEQWPLLALRQSLFGGGREQVGVRVWLGLRSSHSLAYDMGQLNHASLVCDLSACSATTTLLFLLPIPYLPCKSATSISGRGFHLLFMERRNCRILRQPFPYI